LRSLPELTDHSRALLLRSLLHHQRLSVNDLVLPNGEGSTPIHCAAQSSSVTVLEVALSHLH
jgi:hypothetical protein